MRHTVARTAAAGYLAEFVEYDLDCMGIAVALFVVAAVEDTVGTDVGSWHDRDHYWLAEVADFVVVVVVVVVVAAIVVVAVAADDVGSAVASLDNYAGMADYPRYSDRPYFDSARDIHVVDLDESGSEGFELDEKAVVSLANPQSLLRSRPTLQHRSSTLANWEARTPSRQCRCRRP